MANHNAYTPADQVILDAARLAQDPGAANLGKPFYDACLRDAVQDLCYDTAWDIVTKEYDMPENGLMELPCDVAGIRHIYAYNGDNCNVDTSVDVHIKPNFTHKGGTGFFAQQKGVNVDAIVDNTFWWFEPSGLYYCGVEMGCIHFSSSCQGFAKVRLVYQGLGQHDECEVAAVPTWARRAVVDYIAHRACQMRMSENASFYNTLERKFDWQLTNVMGSWRTAQMRYKRMDYKQRQDSNIYNTSFGHDR